MTIGNLRPVRAGEPDPLRLRYRGELAEAVRQTVLSGAPPRPELLRGWAERRGIPAEDVGAFAERALALLLGLHEGSLHRYNLLVSDFTAWRSRFSAGN